MRKGLFVTSVIVLIIGIGLVALSVYAGEVPTKNDIPAGQDLALLPSGVGPVYLSLSWSNAAAGSTIYVTSDAASCVNPTGIVASGTGASGSLSATLNSGSTYHLYACSGASSTSVTLTYTYFGFSILFIIGIVLAVIGIVLMIVSLRKRAKAMPAMPPATPGPMPPTGQ